MKVRTVVGVVLIAAAGVGWIWLRPRQHKSAIQQTGAAESKTPSRLPHRGPSLRIPASDGPVSPGQASPLGDAEAMTRLRVLVRSDPAGAVSLARESMARFPDSPDAAERHKLLIDALLNIDRYPEARGEAERMVNIYVGTPWALEIERRTGAHPHVRPYVPSRP